jgi:hypothetical protein
MSEVGENGFWHTTRPHDDECEILRAKGATACIAGCRVGQPWPTVRLLPSDQEKAKKLREQMKAPRRSDGQT